MISKDSNSKPEQMLNVKALLHKSGWRHYLTVGFRSLFCECCLSSGSGYAVVAFAGNRMRQLSHWFEIKRYFMFSEALFLLFPGALNPIGFNGHYHGRALFTGRKKS
ncbi:hypothetical protein AKG12_21865 [Agrobacterium sp. SUL3]|nr:hypothetical protein AKG12_21865 [Agrobacterium sp. SUL3]